MSSLEYCKSALTTLKLKGMFNNLDSMLDRSQNEKLSYVESLKLFLETEISDRNGKRLERNLAGAHLPALKELESFDFTNIEGIDSCNL